MERMGGFRFLKYKVYRDARSLKTDLSAIVERIKSTRDYSLKDQLERASLSVVLNIAEASSRRTKKDFSRFIIMALGSLNEVIACLDILKEQGLLREEAFGIFVKKAENIGRQLSGLIRSNITANN